MILHTSVDENVYVGVVSLLGVGTAVTVNNIGDVLSIHPIAGVEFK
jgi:hypothetical protein